MQRSKSGSRIDLTGGLGLKVSKEYDFEIIVNKKRLIFPLLMRRYKSLPNQKPAFMFDLISDMKSLYTEFQENSSDILDNFTPEKESERMLFQPEKSIEKGFLLINFSQYLQTRISVNVTGSKVFVENWDNMNGFINAMNLC